jgi:hypothetical protein
LHVASAASSPYLFFFKRQKRNALIRYQRYQEKKMKERKIQVGIHQELSHKTLNKITPMTTTTNKPLKKGNRSQREPYQDAMPNRTHIETTKKQTTLNYRMLC